MSIAGAPEAGLSVRGLVVRYGGLLAVDNVDLDVPLGRVTGLIGPNGAGKTTIFNACSGLVRPTSGGLALLGRDIGRLSLPRRAQLGLGRTFQKIELWNSLTVEQNVALGREGLLAGSRPWTQVAGRRSDRAQIAAATGEAIARCGLEGVAERPVGTLPTGVRRLVELARVLASGARVLLLDEPSSGLDNAESERFGEVLRAAVTERGLGVMLVEHHMALVLDTCDHIYVLDFGRLLFQGAPEDIVASPAVRSAYLGEAA